MLKSTTPPIAMSPAEAARLAGIGRTRLYAAIGAGELPSLKLGSRRLVRRADLEVWLNRFVCASPAQPKTPRD